MMGNKEFDRTNELEIAAEIPQNFSVEHSDHPGAGSNGFEKREKFENAYDTEGNVEEGVEEKPDDEKKQEIVINENREDKKGENKENQGSSSEHDGKYFVIPKGKAKCNQGISFPNFKVTSHQKHYWNDAEGQADYLAVTEDDLQFNPAIQPFGAQCKLQPSGSGYKPCSYSPAGKWHKCYDKVKVMGKSCVTEISELQCVIGGKITVMKHGQQSEIGKSNVKNADALEQHVYNPVVDFEEFQEEILDNSNEAW